MFVGYNDRYHTSRKSALMGNVVSLSQHQATKQMQIREAEKRAKEALHQASLA